MSSRVAESYLWECKQLGAYSPIVLLNTLLFFCTKHFGYTTLEQHHRLAFANFTRCSKACSRAGKASYLLHRSSSTAPARQETGTPLDPPHCPPLRQRSSSSTCLCLQNT